MPSTVRKDQRAAAPTAGKRSRSDPDDRARASKRDQPHRALAKERPGKARTVLITGATAGLGHYLATVLAGAGWTVLAHGRSVAKLDELVSTIGEVDGTVTPLRADLAALSEVQALAATVGKRTSRLDALVNNAGVGFGAPGDAREVSRDGHELRFAVNYLAPVMLSRLLTPLLTASAPSRVVNVGSLGQASIDRDDPETTRDYDGTLAYRRSKLALAAHSFDLAEQLRGTGVTVNCIHPATFMATTMVLDSGIAPRSTIAEGGEATLRLITEPSFAGVSGQFFDGERPSRALDEAYDRGFRSWLRGETDRLLAA